MEHLENTILAFDHWENPWTFQKFVLSHLDTDNRNVFNHYWTIATAAELWNHSDLILGCKACHKQLRKQTPLSDAAIAAIVRAVSYEWN
ncbi:hypothetical protein [Flavobacterium kingsejongi]|uniref:Uncharacterized protein n=1 Tax=Flavobacterium kingsejongi TaxID=1678728 RepID=A0A2S1LM40_9FLAO|nr:hypothetical protein [Flavobacterium kingsejongi]AWG24758.1 hypothetical protein FK004_05700 [Flavobacterium kingsejongi]